MSEVTLHPIPQIRDIAREQVRMIGQSLSREAVVAGLVVGLATLVISIDIFRGTATTWFDSDEWMMVGLFAFLFPFAVWRRERHFGPAFLWTLPVDRRQLALARVFAGWVWLMTAALLFILWQTILALLSGVADAQAVPLVSLSGATGLYLLGSALVLGMRHPLRWLFGTIGVILLLGSLNEIVGRTDDEVGPLAAWTVELRSAFGAEALRSSGGLSALDSAWGTLPAFARWAISTLLWVGVGFAALLPAVSRHSERRRR